MEPRREVPQQGGVRNTGELIRERGGERGGRQETNEGAK